MLAPASRYVLAKHPPLSFTLTLFVASSCALYTRVMENPLRVFRTWAARWEENLPELLANGSVDLYSAERWRHGCSKKVALAGSTGGFLAGIFIAKLSRHGGCTVWLDL